MQGESTMSAPGVQVFREKGGVWVRIPCSNNPGSKEGLRVLFWGIRWLNIVKFIEI